MTTMSRVTMPKLDAFFAAATAGSAPGAITSPTNGDLIPISSGSGTLIIFITSGTGSVVTLANKVAPPYGTGGDITVTLGTTDIQAVYIANDGTDRFDPGQGQANQGFVSLSYTSTAAIKVYAVTIP